MSRLDPGDVLARRYLLLDPLAHGGMSVIWRAFDQSLHRLVAVKVLTASLQAGLGERVRVRSEARAAARFLHPDVIEIYDYGETVTEDGEVAAYVVMPLLDGTTLGERIAEGPLPWTEAAAIALRLARALRDGHARGLVHRDVTADNVLLTASGPKLLDFGIAASPGDPDDDRGTPPYVAPERLAGAPTHPAVDVYALGVLLFAMLTGRTPYPETTWEQIEAAHRTSPPPRVTGAPHGIATLCRNCLAHDPARRPTAAEIADSLATALAGAALGRQVRRGLAVAGAGVIALSSLLWLNGPIGLPTPPSPSAGIPVTPRSSTDATATLRRSPGTTTGPRLSADTTTGPQLSTDATATTRPSDATAVTTATTRPSGRRSATIRQAVDGFHGTLAGGEACRATDQDVTLDLQQILRRVLDTPGPIGPGMAELKRKLADREREGRLTPACRTELQARLDEIATAHGPE
ncbi:serine/threonine-protein kinase [Nonomuraea sp. NEAU-A123]|uniref:serine/threonine-protein kinase n=1 Tax=Nonomuraea sp. NEAU-A123 TaxID=2839649 RepID=UPI001BE441A8|nr:serine/threonine-protein kinase [Nonomuraea sp. NEAU-A123]MBT2234562.1 serine/threonine protein kinase [Nonomuraea sp. NEAU-A123]